MTTQVYEATFEDGAFRPVRPLSAEIAEGQRVRPVVEIEEQQDILDLAACVYKGLTDLEIGEVEQIALDRRKLFGSAAP